MINEDAPQLYACRQNNGETYHSSTGIFIDRGATRVNARSMKTKSPKKSPIAPPKVSTPTSLEHSQNRWDNFSETNSQQAIDELRRRIRAKTEVPAGYSTKNWDPTEDPIFLPGSAFDANSLGKWIYDWPVYRHGPGTVELAIFGYV
ncbi:MAG: hypothetical protein M1816_002694 [Peltula sp. TS41687]|nr:MAG: hypothetical protein M1816_002694 [Peltula sp. TS41687]